MEKKLHSIRMDEKTYKMATEMAKKAGLSFSAYIRLLISKNYKK